jgi:hypothetical protein
VTRSRRREAAGLRHQLDELQDLFRDYNRNGLTAAEMNTLQARINGSTPARRRAARSGRAARLAAPNSRFPAEKTAALALKARQRHVPAHGQSPSHPL